MAAQSHYLPALHKLFRTRPVALLSDLRKALQTPSRTTVFCVLSSVGYLASYSHAGRYYTLKRIPQFDPRGLWHYRQRSEEHTSELQSRFDLVCRLLLEKTTSCLSSASV